MRKHGVPINADLFYKTTSLDLNNVFLSSCSHHQIFNSVLQISIITRYQIKIPLLVQRSNVRNRMELKSVDLFYFILTIAFFVRWFLQTFLITIQYFIVWYFINTNWTHASKIIVIDRVRSFITSAIYDMYMIIKRVTMLHFDNWVTFSGPFNIFFNMFYF